MLRPAPALLLALLAATQPAATQPAATQPAATQPAADTFRLVAADFGVVARADVDNRAALQRAIDRAWYQRQTEDRRAIALVELPCHRPFARSGEAIGYAGSLVLRDSVLLAGCGGTRLAQRADDLGQAFWPVVEAYELGAPQETRLRLLDGALDRRRPDGRPEVHRIQAAPDVALIGARDVVFDGNWEGNLDAYRRFPAELRESYFRNGVAWSGPMINNHGGVAVRCAPDGGPGALGQFTRVAVVGYGATGLLGHACARFELTDVLVADALYNHTIYNADGVWRNVTVAGFAWTHLIVQHGTTAENLVYWRAAPNPIGRRNPDLVNVRGGSFYVRGFYADTRLPGRAPERPDDAEQLFSNAPTAEVDVSGLVWVAGRGGVLASGGVRFALDGARVHAAHSISALHAAWGPAGTYALRDVVVESEQPGRMVFVDRTGGGAWQLDRVRMTAGYAGEGAALEVERGTGQPRSATFRAAITRSVIRGLRAGGAVAVGGGAWGHHPRLCADTATREASPGLVPYPPHPECAALLVEPIRGHPAEHRPSGP
ncbi:MAG: hypothetical protein ACK41D_03335 [Rubricoccaceae bacterium]